MAVLDFNKAVTRELSEAFGRLGSGEFSDRAISVVAQRLLGRRRLGECRRMAMFLGCILELRLDPYRMCFVDHPSQDGLAARLVSAQGREQRTRPLSVKVGPGQITLSISDGTEFELSLKTLPTLVLSVRSLSELLGFEALTKAVTGLKAAPTDAATLQSVAEAWGDALDQTRQRLRGSSSCIQRGKAIMRYLDGVHGERRYGALDVLDEHVVAFWEEEAPKGQYDVKQFSTVRDSFKALVVELAELGSQEAVVEPSPGDPSSGAGRLSARSDEAVSPGGRTSADALETIMARPGGIKFLVGTKAERAVDLAEASDGGARLLISAVYQDRFSPVQLQLSRAKPAAKGGPIFERASPLDGAKAIVSTTVEALRRTLFASLDVLIAHRRAGALRLSQALHNNDEPGRASLRDLLVQVAGIDDGALARLSVIEVERRLLDALAHSEHPLIADLRTQAAHHWRNIDRAGFLKAQRDDRAVIESLDFYAEDMCWSYEHLGRLSRRLNSRHPELGEMEEMSRRFKETFVKIYQDLDWREDQS